MAPLKVHVSSEQSHVAFKKKLLILIIRCFVYTFLKTAVGQIVGLVAFATVLLYCQATGVQRNKMMNFLKAN